MKPAHVGQVGNLRFDKTGRRLAFSAESAQSARDVYVYDLNHNALERWTRSETGPLDVGTFVPAELVRYPTWDRVAGPSEEVITVRPGYSRKWSSFGN